MSTQFKASHVLGWLAVVALGLLPLSDTPFLVYLITLACIMGIFAMGFDLLYGYTGLVSFGHSVFYGVPAYALGAVGATLFTFKNPFILVGSAMAMGLLLGLIVGFFCTFSRGIYLALITFAFAQIFWLLVLSDPYGITYGENGIMAVRPGPYSIAGYTFSLFSGTGLYYLVLATLVGSYFIIRWLVRSPLGDILQGIKHNEDRLISLGYNTRPYKIVSFMLSGLFASVAGALTVFLNNSVVPSMVDWHIGAEVLLITIMGGSGTLIGPIVASFLVVFTESYASSWIGAGNWVYVMGGLYVGVVMFLPGGIFNSNYLKRRDT